MAFGHFIDTSTGQYTEDHLIGNAMENLRIRFGNKLPQDFYGQQWERARRILRIEGRDTQTVISSLLPFAEAQSSEMAQRNRKRQVDADSWEKKGFTHLASMMRKGIL